MTFEERVDAAWDAIGDSVERFVVERAITAAFSDIYGDAPTAWIAPIVATEEMGNAAWDERIEIGEHFMDSVDARKAWDAMRDAHLKK